MGQAVPSTIHMWDAIMCAGANLRAMDNVHLLAPGSAAHRREVRGTTAFVAEASAGFTQAPSLRPACVQPTPSLA